MNEKIKDSGSTQEYATGAHRDNPTGKGRCDLLPLFEVCAVMHDDPVIKELALFMDTRDTSHLFEALRQSLGTVELFCYANITRSLNETGISCRDLPPECEPKAVLAHMMLEASKLYEAGAEKYGANNWQFGMPVNRYIDSGTRHYLKTLRGDNDEPHYRGFVWNLLCAAWTAEHHPELNFKDEPKR